jgi:Mg2+ and Co2+ transporter CorA
MKHEKLPADIPASPQTRILLFDADGEDREIEAGDLDLSRLSENELAWIDIRVHDASQITQALCRFGIEGLPLASLMEHRNGAWFTQRDWFGARAIAPTWDAEHETFSGAAWLLAVGPNVVVTVHRRRIAFLEALFANDDPDSRVGKISADSFAAALLDRLLTTYFDAVDAFEERLDRLEVEILEPKLRHTHLPSLRRLRRAVSILRRLLSAHRDVFDTFSRPDFQPDQDEKVEKQFRSVSLRYERAVDAVENARDLVVGSYELLSTRLSQRTNESMRLLTFVTVLLGSLAVIAGMLGMNFRAGIFDTGSEGFWTAVGLMALVVLVALLIARWRGWWK